MTDPSKQGGRSTFPRRKFLDGFLGGSVVALMGAVLYPVLRYLSPPNIPEAAGNQVLAGTVSEMEQVGWKTFPFGSEPGILVRTADGEFRAFSALCTHLDCTVQFDTPSSRLWCACHNGWYDLTGRNVDGPPPRPLMAFEVRVVGDEIFVTRT